MNIAIVDDEIIDLMAAKTYFHRYVTYEDFAPLLLDKRFVECYHRIIVNIAYLFTHEHSQNEQTNQQGKNLKQDF